MSSRLAAATQTIAECFDIGQLADAALAAGLAIAGEELRAPAGAGDLDDDDAPV